MFAAEEAKRGWKSAFWGSEQREFALCCSERLARGSVQALSRASAVRARSTLCRYHPCTRATLLLGLFPWELTVF